ncbi:MAG: bifunctional demethylmenaquinone methyltransferase/2-methoxy-6-polyprenyl-1,4-benzoquinol methylase UbiE [Gammaproteobacteria bacterium]|nr:MAG: bifunctional demethylmenaquinone methyltransferase/2-methoxy-6-polyprenyl-1,4-benzoquinol methylase UbiE [Gammaproteobacteria bacterium]
MAQADNKLKKDGITHFGYQEVAVEDKTRLVNGVFESVADKYDLMNDLMSLGVHRLWKRHFIAISGIQPGQRVLDLAGGTGDIAALMSKQVGAHGRVVLSDINAAMLAVGRRRMEDRGLVGNIEYSLANAEQLPFADAKFDAVTIAFGLRNVTDQPAALKEMLRVLKPGGRAMILEFSSVEFAGLKKIYDTYSFGILPRLGKIIADDEDSYRYLAESIRKHPDQEKLAGMLEDAGFSNVTYRNMTGGIVAIHSGYHG